MFILCVVLLLALFFWTWKNKKGTIAGKKPKLKKAKAKKSNKRRPSTHEVYHPKQKKNQQQ